jgi:hypothetical protein
MSGKSKIGQVITNRKSEIIKPAVWVVPPGVHHITISRTADGKVLEHRDVRPGQIIMLDAFR